MTDGGGGEGGGVSQEYWNILRNDIYQKLLFNWNDKHEERPRPWVTLKWKEFPYYPVAEVSDAQSEVVGVEMSGVNWERRVETPDTGRREGPDTLHHLLISRPTSDKPFKTTPLTPVDTSKHSLPSILFWKANFSNLFLSRNVVVWVVRAGIHWY